MSSVIGFLEKMGMNAQLRHASQEEIAEALSGTQMESALGAAIIAKSTSDLYALLRLKPLFHVQMDPGGIIPPGIEEKEEEKESEVA